MMNKKELREKCVDLLIKTYTSLGQTPAEDTVLAMSLLLAVDLEWKFKNMTWEQIEMAFYNGVRDTDDFSINAKTWCRWMNTMKKRIWEGHYNANKEQPNLHAVGRDIRKLMKIDINMKRIK